MKVNKYQTKHPKLHVSMLHKIYKNHFGRAVGQTLVIITFSIKLINQYSKEINIKMILIGKAISLMIYNKI
jgi:hypothetical protein